MLVAFLIMLREGIEAALIVGIVAGFLKQSGHSKLMPKVWFGVVLASLMCLGLGYGIHSATGEIPQKQQEFVVGIIGLVAVAMLTYMILWMKKAARSMKQQLQDSVQAALNRGSGQGWALVGMAFLAVAREGLESVFFLLAVFKQSPTWQMPAGAVAGVLAAAVIGALIYQGGMRLNLAKFFRWTGVFLIVVAAGLLAGSMRALHEAGVWNSLQDIVFDSSKYLHEDSPLGVLLGGFFGYTDHPTQGEALVWLLYLIPVMTWFLRGSRPSETLTRKEELK
ncbi:iron uptake transporter permease EfeU [Neisseria cinerea]|uniref:iron uptake transporter permease EfeU n=1 Tax=Neisseria cinerea TaxID=483 RepID=UPI000D341AF1|nr:iron uptake transporter permease EfeU [Neisseria cinerea]